MKKIELLSPVGNMEMLYQAIHNGADAVYLAGKLYGARKFSNNFTNEELKKVIKYSHLYDVMVYVTVNTLINENEIEEFLEYIKFLYINGVDALIMQDIGMIKLVKETFPNINIHASTQAHNYSEEGIKLLKELGCTRVVMAREMSLDEINKIDLDIEKEVFVYGALCVSYSGQCLFSSLNGGRSGNRGECVGSCRLPYRLIKNDKYINTKGNYLLSMKDLNTFDNLKEILDSNISSLKIEGRMKSPYYVGYVTRLYRTLIDKYYNNEKMSLTEEEKINLKKLFNREFTKGFLFNDKDVTNIKSPNHIGIELGKVIQIDKKFIYIKLNTDINREDGIRFTSTNEGMIVNKLYNHKKLLVNNIYKNNTCLIEKKVKTKVGDTVLKTIDSKLIKELENYSYKKIPVQYTVDFKINKPFVITITDGINKVTEYGDIVELSKNNEVTKDNIIKCLSKLGNTPFVSNKIDINKDNNIFVSLKSINEIRRKVIDELIKKRISTNKNININKVLPKNNLNIQKKNNLNILVRTEEQLKCAIDNKLDSIYVTDYELYNKYKKTNNIYYRIPRIDKENISFNNSNLLVTDLSSLNKYKKNNKINSDYYLNVTNSKTVELLNEIGVSTVTISPELDIHQIKDIMKNNYNIEIIIYGRLELMIMKYCPLKKCLNYCNKCSKNTDKFYLEDRYNNKFPIIHNKCITSIMHSKNINKIDEIKIFKEIGIKNYRIELFDENKKETEKCIQDIKKML